jgi:AAA domain
MVGESRAGKTFLALNLAQALAKGDTFLTKRARAGGTLYIAAEAPGTIQGRLQAARLGPLAPFLDEKGNDKGTGQEPAPLCIATVSQVPDLLTDEGQGQLIAAALDVSDEMRGRFGLPLSLIVIDTMLAAFDIRDWNDPGDTRRIMSALASIGEKTGAVVLGVHHHGKDVSRGAAGSYALTAAADFVLSVFADVETDGVVSGRRVSLTKLRDGPTGWSCEFGLHSFKIGVDDEGMDIVSAFVDPKPSTAGFNSSGRTQQKKKPASESLVALNKAVDEALQQSGADRTIPGTGTVRAVQVANVRAAFARHYRPRGKGGKNTDGQRQAFKRALKAVLEEGSVKQDSWDGVDWLWRKGE